MKYLKNLTYTLVALILFLTTACNNEDAKRAEKLKLKADSLTHQLAKRDSAYSSIMGMMVTVEDQIDQIKEREYAINLDNENDLNKSMKDRIISDMNDIDQLILSSRQTIRNLSDKLDAADFSNQAFKLKIEKLQLALTDRTLAIGELKKTLAAKNLRIIEMSDEMMVMEGEMVNKELKIKKQDEIINEQQNAMLTAYFKAGTEDQLEKAKIITKVGGFLGLGQELDVRADLNKADFEKINILENKEFVIASTDVELITEHPSSSFTLISTDKETILSILNPEDFWSISKYLIISK